jgi:hypothetical protein
VRRQQHFSEAWRTHGDGYKMRLETRLGRIRTAELELMLRMYAETLTYGHHAIFRTTPADQSRKCEIL